MICPPILKSLNYTLQKMGMWYESNSKNGFGRRWLLFIWNNTLAFVDETEQSKREHFSEEIQ